MIRIKKNCNEAPKGEKYTNQRVKDFLRNSHHNKCCYCETAYIKGEVEHFRPKSKYDWLIDDCENLLWACHECNNLKGSKLPVVEKKATNPDSVTICDEKEELRMINPARYKADDLDIAFTKTGEISSDNELMQNTIEICNLNRENLANSRLSVYNDFESTINSMKRFVPKEKRMKFVLEQLVNPIIQNPELRFIAFQKYIIRHWLKKMMQ